MIFVLLVAKAEARHHLSSELLETVVELLRGLVEVDVRAVAEAEDGELGVCVEVVRQTLVGERLPEVAAVGRELALATSRHDAEHLLLFRHFVEVDVVHRQTLGANAATLELVCPDLHHHHHHHQHQHHHHHIFVYYGSCHTQLSHHRII